MKIETAKKQRIVRNAILSLFIFLLPVALMYTTFFITGERPWEKKAPKQTNVKPSTTKTNLNNGSND